MIGNSDYQYVPRLPNPVGDAQSISGALTDLGFAVTSLTNSSRRELGRKVLEFARKADGADVALVFYAGHGIQINGVNYLVPVDARLQDDLAVGEEAYKLDDLLDAMGSAKTRLVFMDACRDNPFANQMKRYSATRSVGRGLARVRSNVSGSLIAFATDPDNVALDGSGRNSPFTQALLKVLPQSGVEIRLAMGRVRAEVARLTQNKQIPWVSESLFGELYLGGEQGVEPSGVMHAAYVATDASKATRFAVITEIDTNFGYLVVKPIDGAELSAGDVLFVEGGSSRNRYTVQRGYGGMYSVTGELSGLEVGGKLYGN
ncbi:caspase family protein [Spongiibacter sp. KMU-158]|uniref:Caspase family protein n=1 Tax=Spongiibacter pelagi TaxID=2760804 RepID=A0A927GVC9_9GAMM|nr:caspase family protein [Spongiibacter pelagi]MBD2857747.1 caspase family protein [Spongiibacter pelagi]